MIPLSEGLGLVGKESKEAGRDAGMEVAGEGTGECRPGRAGGAKGEERAKGQCSQPQFYKCVQWNLPLSSHFPTRESESQREVTILSPHNSRLAELNFSQGSCFQSQDPFH